MAEAQPSTWVKKPVAIQAVQLNAQVDLASVARWCGGVMLREDGQAPHLMIPTLEGGMLAAPGDWIICGVAGEFYPCKPDIFAATYRSADIT